LKGFDVLACPCANSDAALAQLEQIYSIRKNANRAEFSKPLSFRMKGVLETSWMSTRSFIRGYYGQPDDDPATARASANAQTSKAIFAEVRKRSPASSPPEER
jgi:hypothetical protein